MATILQAFPPNYAQILSVFPSAQRRGVIFSYYPNIHCPGAKTLPAELIAHEEVHLHRQKMAGVERWWEEYLRNPAFRYQEELIAHQVEYRHLMANAPSRTVRRMALKHTAARLASGLYGQIVTHKKAMEDILCASTTIFTPITVE